MGSTSNSVGPATVRHRTPSSRVQPSERVCQQALHVRATVRIDGAAGSIVAAVPSALILIHELIHELRGTDTGHAPLGAARVHLYLGNR